MHKPLTLMLGLALFGAPTYAAEPDADGLIGVGLASDTRSDARQALDAQAAAPVKGQELSLQLFVKTQERLAETFSRPVPDTLGESTSDQ